jgi:hypothetical protein
MADFFCFTCRTHKPIEHRAPGCTHRAICNACDAIRARRVAKPSKPSTASQVRAGQRVLFTHLRRIGEL